MMVLSEAFSSDLGLPVWSGTSPTGLGTLCRELRPVNDGVQSRNNRCRLQDSRPSREDRLYATLELWLSVRAGQPPGEGADSCSPPALAAPSLERSEEASE